MQVALASQVNDFYEEHESKHENMGQFVSWENLKLANDAKTVPTVFWKKNRQLEIGPTEWTPTARHAAS